MHAPREESKRSYGLGPTFAPPGRALKPGMVTKGFKVDVTYGRGFISEESVLANLDPLAELGGSP